MSPTRRRLRCPFTGLLVALCLGGCDDAGVHGVPPPHVIVLGDARVMDAAPDASARDRGLVDAGVRDLGLDRSMVDRAVLDAAPVDAAPRDATVDARPPPDMLIPDMKWPDMLPADMAPPAPDMLPPDMAPPAPDMLPPDMALPVACPEFDDAIVTGNVGDPGVVEASGIAESRRTPGVLWMHNDSGDGNRIFAVGADGARLGVFELDGGRPRDWEDLAVGPGPDPALSYLYLGDVGDNASARANIRVRRLPEPAVPMGDAPFTIDIEDAESLTLVYPDGAHNCETLLVDPRSGDLYVVVKSGDGDSPVYRAAAPLPADGVVPLEHVADLQFGVAPLRGDRSTTAGDISPSGDEIIIRTYNRAYLWRRAPGATVAEALGTEPCAIPQAGERQGEAIGYSADGDGYYTVSEGANQPIHYYRRR